MKKIVLCFILVFSIISLFAQDIHIPKNYKLIKIEDYEPYKDTVKLIADWLIRTPLNIKKETREEANKFLFRWISGAPYTHINIIPQFTNDIINDTNSKEYTLYIFMNYIAGMTLVKIENNNSDETLTQKAGILAMLEGYKSIRKNYKNKFLEKLLKLEKKGKLDIWIKDIHQKNTSINKTKIIPKD